MEESVLFKCDLLCYMIHLRLSHSSLFLAVRHTSQWFKKEMLKSLKRTNTGHLKAISLLQQTPLYPRFHLRWFQLPPVKHGLEAGGPPAVRAIAAQHCVTVPASFTSLPLIGGHFVISHHHQKGGYSAIRYFERERDHIHGTFITVYYYNNSIFLSVTVVDLPLCLIYKLNFIIRKYV